MAKTESDRLFLVYRCNACGGQVNVEVDDAISNLFNTPMAKKSDRDAIAALGVAARPERVALAVGRDVLVEQ